MDESQLTFVKLDITTHQDTIQSFDCGKEMVNTFLPEESFKHHESRKVITHLAFDENQNLIGYFSLFNESVTVVKSKRDQQQWTDLAGDEKSVFPAIRLHFLGVDQRYQKQGFGKRLLYEAIRVAKGVSESSGCIFMTLETEQDTYRFYEDRFFVYLRRSENDGNLTDMCLRLQWFN